MIRSRSSKPLQNLALEHTLRKHVPWYIHSTVTFQPSRILSDDHSNHCYDLPSLQPSPQSSILSLCLTVFYLLNTIINSLQLMTSLFFWEVWPAFLVPNRSVRLLLIHHLGRITSIIHQFVLHFVLYIPADAFMLWNLYSRCYSLAQHGNRWYSFTGRKCFTEWFTEIS